MSLESEGYIKMINQISCLKTQIYALILLFLLPMTIFVILFSYFDSKDEVLPNDYFLQRNLMFNAAVFSLLIGKLFQNVRKNKFKEIK